MAMDGVVKFDYQNKEHVDAIARLHAELLGESLIPRLGNKFITSFYYTRLVKDNLIRCELYRYKGKYVAFSVCTEFPFTFMKDGIRRNVLYLSLLMFRILLLNPSRIKVVIETIRIGKNRQMRTKENRVSAKIGEILSFGILSDYGAVRDEFSGLRVTNLLFERVLDYLKDRQVTHMEGEIKKDNKPSLLLWQSYGGIIMHDTCSKGDQYLVTVRL